MRKSSYFNDIYQRCLRLLTYREYSQQELRQKLNKQYGDSQIIEDCLMLLVQKDYQSDQRFIEIFCRSRVSKYYGRKKIYYDLKQKGIDESLINAQLACYDELWLENAIYITKRKFLHKDKDAENIFKNYSLTNKIKQFLTRKGYEYDIINNVIKSLKFAK